MPEISVRPIEQSDHDEWRRLWTAYLTFYETTIPDSVYASTWTRLFADGEYEPKGLLAFFDGSPVGLVHYLFHRTCWSEKNNCYLQDLYANPEMRGKGIGRALIEAVYAVADARDAATVYWTTQEFNHTARRLYDRIGGKTPFIKYQRR
jgi:GNAT superfamily N-acetyltransferase